MVPSMELGPGPVVFGGRPACDLLGGGCGGEGLGSSGCLSESDVSSLSTSTSSSNSCLWDDVLGAPVEKREYACTTADGVKIVLVRATCSSPAAPGARKRAHPVLLVPGLASSAEATYDIMPRYSLHDHLARQGYDTWRVDLRGNGRSGVPANGREWNVDDHLFQDLPAVVKLVLKETGAQQLHWVGHSMGGMLATGAMSLQGYVSRHIRSITMLGSGCFGAGSWHSVLKPLVLALCVAGFPGGFAGGVVGKLVGSWCSPWPIETLFYWGSNTEACIGRKLISTCFRYIPRSLVDQFMSSLNSPDGLTTADGRLRYADPKILRHVSTPVLGVCGDWDLFCPAPGGLRTVQTYGSQARKFVFLGPGYGTSKMHYGHFDVIMGRHAREEVWPHVTAHLEENDAPVVSGIADLGSDDYEEEAAQLLAAQA